jgi:uncharacterized protein
VIKSIISETNQQASGPTPYKTDLQLLALLKKKKGAAELAIKEAEAAARPELKEKQEIEITVLDEYASTVQLMPLEELKVVVEGVVAKLDAAGRNQGKVMKGLLAPGGELEGKPIDKSQLAGVVKQVLGGS